MRRPVPAYAAAVEEGRPIADLNMTPLIDVLLVLIVMFIMLVPVVTHKITIDLPQGPVTVAATPHRLVLARAGAVSLDGVGVNDAALGARLTALVRADAGATVVLASDPLARYERVDQLLAVVKQAGVTRLGFEGLAAMDRPR